MDFHMKLPRNGKEAVLFLGIIAFLSVNIIAPLITFLEVGFSTAVWINTLQVMPLLLVVIIALVLLTHKPAVWMKSKFVKKEDSFYPHIIIETLCTVFLMSIVLTVVGTWIGTRHISMEPIYTFFYKWPRNFAIAFFVESLIAQPIARFVMFKLHTSQDAKVQEA